MHAKGQMADMETIAIDIRTNLATQGDQLDNIKNNTAKVDENVGLGKMILHRMKKYESRYVIMYISTILVLLILMAVVSYIIYTKKAN